AVADLVGVEREHLGGLEGAGVEVALPGGALGGGDTARVEERVEAALEEEAPHEPSGDGQRPRPRLPLHPPRGALEREVVPRAAVVVGEEDAPEALPPERDADVADDALDGGGGDLDGARVLEDVGADRQRRGGEEGPPGEGWRLLPAVAELPRPPLR